MLARASEIRSARAAGHLVHERCGLRLNLQRVPQAEVRQGLRRGAPARQKQALTMREMRGTTKFVYVETHLEP